MDKDKKLAQEIARLQDFLSIPRQNEDIVRYLDLPEKDARDLLWYLRLLGYLKVSSDCEGWYWAGK